MSNVERRKSEPVIRESKNPVRALTVTELEAVAGSGFPGPAPRPNDPICGCSRPFTPIGAPCP